MTRPPEQQQALDRITRNLTLYHFPGCPFCLATRWAIHQLGLGIELKDIHSDPEARDELMAGGGRTMVPCLRIDGGSDSIWMYESADIIRYLRELPATA